MDDSRPGGTDSAEPSEGSHDAGSEPAALELDGVVDLVDADRRHIARLIHDDLSQVLTGVSLLADGLALQLAPSDRELAEEASRLSELGREAVVLTRRLSQALAPSPLGYRGLRQALEQLAADTQEQYADVRCRADVDDLAVPTDRGVSEGLYRIAQETTVAAIRDRRASRVEITLSRSGSVLRLEVTDDGSPRSSDPTSPSGLTAYLMAARARSLGALVELSEREGGGAVLACTLESGG